MNDKKPWYKRWTVWAAAFLVFTAFSATMGALLPEVSHVNTYDTTVTDAELKVENEKAETKAVKVAKESEAKAAELANEKAEVVDEVSAESTERDDEVRSIIENIHADRYTGSEIVEIEVNENLGLNDGSYVVLAHFSFTRNNSAEKTLNFISMYSEDLAASLAETADVSAVTVFYEAPRFIEGMNATKFAYKRSGADMVLDNEFIVPELK